MKTIVSFGLALFFLALPLRAEMIQGDGYSFFLSAPMGWVLDETMAADAEADAVLYPQGTTYQSAASVLTVSAAFKGDGFKDLADLMRQDEADSRQQNPEFSLQKGPLLQTRLQKKVLLYFYLGLKDGGCEAVAYLEEKDRVMIFMLSSSSEQILREDLPALQETVESYESTGEDSRENPE
ncbi:MAG TPA: hypothetical protein VK859_02860 [bacterium]|jgi:hypothetical protein|nr:hypothetical protein [bacterium]